MCDDNNALFSATTFEGCLLCKNTQLEATYFTSPILRFLIYKLKIIAIPIPREVVRLRLEKICKAVSIIPHTVVRKASRFVCSNIQNFLFQKSEFFGFITVTLYIFYRTLSSICDSPAIIYANISAVKHMNSYIQRVK